MVRSFTAQITALIVDMRLVTTLLGGALLLKPDRFVTMSIDREAARINGLRGLTASLQNIIDRGEAATMEEAQKALSAQGHKAAAANNQFGEVGVGMNAGVAAALAAGKYTKYPGVRWRKDSSKWRVQFSVGGKKVSLGSYHSEEQAARVHDDYVRKHQLARPLHFPADGQTSSDTFRARHEQRKRRTGGGGPSMMMAADERALRDSLWTVALAASAYLSGYASEGYEPHRF